MPGYRLLFTGDNGDRSRAIPFECDDDVEATVFAEDRRSEHVLELWAGRRMVAKFPKRHDI